MNEETLDISKFFSKEAEEEGKWYEPKVRGVGVGFEVKIYGPNSTHAAIASDAYAKARDEIEKITDPEAKSKATDKALAEYSAAIAFDIRGKDGIKLVNKNGTPVTKNDIKDILFNAPVLATDIAKYANKQDNFLSL